MKTIYFEDAVAFNAEIMAKIAESDAMAEDFSARDLEFLATACENHAESLRGQLIDTEGLPHKADDTPVADNAVDEGENSLRFRVLTLLKEGKIQECAEVVTSYLMDALGDLGPSRNGLRNMDRLVACAIRMILAHWAPMGEVV